MKLTQAFKMAFMAIASNKMRSFLTMLGIIIGVTSVSMLISLGQSTTDQVTSRISGLGSNLLSVTIRTSKATFLNQTDIAELIGQDGINAVSPIVTSQKTLKAGRLSTTATIEGVNHDYAIIRNMTVSDGRFIAASDLDARASVAVIGVDIADDLFGTREVVGNLLKVQGSYFTVVGLLTSEGTSIAGSNDSKVIIPYTTAERLLKQTTLRQFYVSTTNSADVKAAETTLNQFMLKELKDVDAYSVFNQTTLLDTLSQITGLLTLLLGGISGISLLVGGIGIMNIMLVSVTERTREIGIRKAIGARRFDIIFQFLIEAVVLSVSGGTIGILISIVGLNLVSKYAGYTLSLTLSVALLSLIFSVAVGLIFGIYPAAKASGLKPIDALRYE
jgi:putative ABC transport system permease protein